MSEYKERKQCPFAFNRSQSMHNMNCLEDQCMAWMPALPEDKMKGDSWNALVEYIEIDRGLPHDIAEEFCKDEAKGHCKLIERGS
jgi:hypothetical protein